MTSLGLTSKLSAPSFREGVKRLSSECRAKHSAIPWSEIAGMRDHCVHGYDNINLMLVWQVTQTHAPELADYLSKIIPAPPSEQTD